MKNKGEKAIKIMYKYLASNGYKILVSDDKKSREARKRVMEMIQNKQKQEMELENEK